MLLAGLTLTAQTEYKFNNRQDGFSIGNRSNTTTTIVHNVSAVTIEQADRQEVEGQFITLAGVHIANTAGAPDLPSGSTFVAIPNGATPSIRLVNAKTKTLSNVDLIPAPQPQLDDDNSPAVYQKDMSIYGRNAFYPATPYNISEVMTVRGVEMVQVGVMPFQYNPVTKELIVYEDLELELTTDGGDGVYGDIRYRTPEWDQILQDMLLNRDALPKVDYGERLRKHYENRETGCEYIIITPDNEKFVQLADSIKQFRTNQGIPTEVFTVTQCGGNTGQDIRNFIRNAYNNWDMPPAAVLILGDHDSDPTQGVVSFTMNNHPGGTGYNPYISDHAYAVTGSNHMPNIILGRITGRDYDEMYHMIKKDLDYERTPPTNPNFYDQPITAMGFQLERWFQLCSEIVNGFWEYSLGKHPVRINAIYEGTPGSRWSTYEYTNTVLNYFGPNGCGYIPNNMSHLTDWSGKGSKVNECINNGAFILQHRDHGAEELWGEPGYSINYINKLTNPDLTYVMSCNCLTGRFNYNGEKGCFAEAFHRHQHGALGLIAATQVSYSFVNDIYVWGSYDNMWPDFMPSYGTQHATNFILPAFGNAAGKFFLRQSSWTDSGVKEITYYLFHQHGDAYMNLYSEVPQHLDVEMLPVVEAGSHKFQIKADRDATICLTANGQVIGYDDATGSTQKITITPQPVGTRIKVTIKKQNYYRYERDVVVIPADEPYLIFNSIEINDTEGNANAEADYNETCMFNVSLHNAGFSNIDNVNVTLTCNHPSVEILQNEAVYGSFNQDEIRQVDNAFTVSFGDGIKDQERIRFHLQMDNGTKSFIDSVEIAVNAPVFSYGDYSMTDLDGEPTDRLMRGQSTMVTFNVANNGHSNSLESTHTLSIKAPFITIPENALVIPSIEKGGQSQVTFQVDVSEEAPNGNLLEFTLNAFSESHTATLEEQMIMGYTMEDFEDETLNTNMEWTLGNGHRVWFIIEDPTANGGHCLRSPELTDKKKSELYIGVDCQQPSTLSFLHRTSTDEGDKLTLYINDVEKAVWSGISGWESSEFQLEQGFNVLNFTYKKDEEGSAGEDCVMIDDLRLPPLAELILFAGNDAETCPDNPFTPNSCISHSDNIEWISDGDGIFDDPHSEQPIYTFGYNDLLNGQVTLSVTASRNNSQQSDDITVSLLESLDEFVLDTPEGDTLVDLRLVSQSQFIGQTKDDVAYHWTLEPEEAGQLSFESAQAVVDWAEDFIGTVTLTYHISNECDDSEASALNIRVMNSTGISESDDTHIEVYPNPAREQVRIKAQGIGSSLVTIRVIDVLGRVVEEMTIAPVDGTIETPISTIKMQRGIYDIQVSNEESTHNTRLLVM